MGVSKDPLLDEHESVSTEGYQYSFIALPERVTTIVAAYIHLIWKIKKCSKSVSPEKIIQNCKAMFEINAEAAIDDLWKEHCASTLRELTDGQLTADFTFALKCLPKQTASNGMGEEIYLSLSAYGRVLNLLAHLNTDSALKELKKIQGFENIKLIDSQAFDKICTDYILILHRLFRENCMKGD